MLELAENSFDGEDQEDDRVGARAWLVRGALALAALLLLAALGWWVKEMVGAPSAPKRQNAKIAILPDTPPPPPPPPKEEKKPEPPKEQPKQAMREEPVKQDVPKPAEPAPLKMEGQAGDGPSAFGAGSVSNDYKGGAPVIGSGSGGGGNPADRAQERLYANSVRQLLHDEIEKHLPPGAGELTATFSVWVEPDGSIRRFDLTPTGDASRDKDLRAAFDQTAQSLHLPGPNGLPQPMRFKLTVRPT